MEKNDPNTEALLEEITKYNRLMNSRIREIAGWIKFLGIATVVTMLIGIIALLTAS